ncbi:MAG: hypothetical protein ACP5KB_00850 [Thermoprotei archaeon]
MTFIPISSWLRQETIKSGTPASSATLANIKTASGSADGGFTLLSSDT